MKRAEAAAWAAFLARLNGRTGNFYAGDPSAETPRGAATGTPLVNGAGQTGTSLITDGWTGPTINILRAGDYIAWDTPTSWREMHMVVSDANSDAGGAVTLVVTPPIRESPADNATIITASATCVMMLASDDSGAWDINEALFYGVEFNAEEVFTSASSASVFLSESLALALSEVSDLVTNSP